LLNDVVDEKWNELLRKMIRPVVIGTIAYHYRKIVSISIRTYEMIGRCLGCTVWRVRIISRFFGEVSRFAKRSVYFICAHVIKPASFKIILPLRPCCVEKVHGADYIRINEIKRRENRPVYMTLCREMNHSLRIVFCKQFCKFLRVIDVSLFKNVIRCLLHIAKVLEIAGVSERIEVDDPVRWILCHEQTDYMRTDEACATGDYDSMRH